MVGFHSFVCTLGEGLPCTGPCARQQGPCPRECTPRGDAQEPADGGEPGPGSAQGRGAEKGGSDCTQGAGVGGSAKVLLSGVWKERSHVLSWIPVGGQHLRNGAGNPGPLGLSMGPSRLGPRTVPAPLSSHAAPRSLGQPPRRPLWWSSSSIWNLHWPYITLSRW